MGPSSDPLRSVAVYGATGRTGKEVVKWAIQRGLRVNAACVRDPVKGKNLLGTHENLTILKGDLANAEDVAAGLVLGGGEGEEEGVVVDAVLCHTGGPMNAKAYQPKDMMLAFVKKLTAAMRAKGVERVLFQAGAFSPPPGEQLSGMTSCMATVLVPVFGIGPMVKDNTSVIEYLSSECSDLQWIVTRPGRLYHSDKAPTDKPMCAGKPGTSLPFADLARFSLDAASEGKYLKQCVCPAYGEE